jgi:hypothetical protein
MSLVTPTSKRLHVQFCLQPQGINIMYFITMSATIATRESSIKQSVLDSDPLSCRCLKSTEDVCLLLISLLVNLSPTYPSLG